MKSNCARYHVLPDKNGEGVMIFDTQSGTTQYPACWQDLAAYYHYLLGRGRFDESQKLLAECMSGNKPISSMLVHMSQAQVNMS